jgi:hypothetical protein
MNDVKEHLQRRKKELLAMAERRGIDWRKVVAAAGEDERLQIALLAAALEMDVRLALNPAYSLPDGSQDSAKGLR